MKQNKINGSSILAASTIVLVILATGVRSELTNADISKNATSEINNEIFSAIIDELQQNPKPTGDKSQQVMPSVLAEVQGNSQWPTTCAEALLSGNGRSGIYQLQLRDYNLPAFQVQCLEDPHNGPGWTVIQRRQDSTTDFFLDWSEYQRGFGDLNTNYFIGLNRIHLMTLSQPHELWIQLEDFEGESRYAKYNSFAIGDEYDFYNLHTLGKFVGTAGKIGDSLTHHKGANFSTKDSDNDKWGGNCADLYMGAWWYVNCAASNLNGIYQNGITAKSDGVFWYAFRGQDYSLKYIHMAIRPIYN